MMVHMKVFTKLKPKLMQSFTFVWLQTKTSKDTPLIIIGLFRKAGCRCHYHKCKKQLKQFLFNNKTKPQAGHGNLYMHT